MPVQRYPGPLSFRKQKPFTQADLCTVLGFTSAVMGCFWGSVLLLPLGLVTSVLGYRRDRTPRFLLYSCRKSFNCPRARESRDLTVPSGLPKIEAVSLTVYCSK